jgi:hypothetical protein
MFVTYDAIRPYMQYVSTTGSVAHLMATDRLLPDTPAGNRPTYPYQVWTQTACGVATPAADDDAACEWVKLTSPYLPTTVFDTGAYKYEDGPWDVDFAALDGQPSIVRVGDALENFSFTLAATTTGVAGVNLSSADLSTLNPGEGSVFTLADGSALPAGLSLDATTGVISGAPSESADGAIVAVQVTQSDGWTTIAGLSRFVVAAPTEVTPVPPTQVVDTVTIPTVTGVDYQVDGVTVTGDIVLEDGQTITVTAVPQPGYVFTENSETSWDFTYAIPRVTPIPPTQVVDTVTIPTVTGVDYQVDGETVTGDIVLDDGQTITVTADATTDFPLVYSANYTSKPFDRGDGWTRDVHLQVTGQNGETANTMAAGGRPRSIINSEEVTALSEVATYTNTTAADIPVLINLQLPNSTAPASSLEIDPSADGFDAQGLKASQITGDASSFTTSYVKGAYNASGLSWTDFSAANSLVDLDFIRMEGTIAAGQSLTLSVPLEVPNPISTSMESTSNTAQIHFGDRSKITTIRNAFDNPGYARFGHVSVKDNGVATVLFDQGYVPTIQTRAADGTTT